MRSLTVLLVYWAAWGSIAMADTVTITPYATVVALGSSDSFTVNVSPGTYVQSVSLAYQGEGGYDQLTAGPFNFSHQFNNPALNLTVTATVRYSNGAADDTATTTINVIGVTLTGNWSPSRGALATYTARSNPTGVSLTRCDWSYTSQTDSGVNTMSDANADGDDKSTWSGTMVDAGTISCTLTVQGLTPQASHFVAIVKRNWTTPITCAQDNESEWGDKPEAGTPNGQNRDRDSNNKEYVFVPRSGAADFSAAVMIAGISSGPCAGWYYVSSTTLKCQRETVINQYIKSTGPALDGQTFLQANESCSVTTDYVLAAKNHEYRGTPDTPQSLEGHQGRIEYAIQLSPLSDPRKHIEENHSRSLSDLRTTTNATILADEVDVYDWALDVWVETLFETNGYNWGFDPGALGSNFTNRWLGSAWSTECNESESF